ncbi:hypothetical protein EV122DRAFT_284962 [Schizophyllum commune]
MALYGIHFALFVSSCVAMIHRPPQTSFLPIATTAIFVFSTFIIIVNRMAYIEMISVLGGRLPAGWLRALLIVQVVGNRVTFFLGDLIVVWRAWVLWKYTRTVRVMLVLCVFGMVGGGVADMVVGIRAHDRGQTACASILARVLTTLLPVLVSSIISTSLVAYRAWQYYRSVNAEYRSRLLPRIGRALLLLIETGAMYIAFWIACLIIGTRSSAAGDGRFYYLWAAITPNVIGIFPTAIILIVATKRSFADPARPTLEGDDTSNAIRFTAYPNSLTSVADPASGSRTEEPVTVIL